MSLRPQENVQKVLISSTARFEGEYENDGILLTHAWPDFQRQSSISRTFEGSSSRNAFIFAFETRPIEDKSDLCIGYSQFVNDICAYLAVLFGKRFDCHGAIEENGYFHVPDLAQYNYLCNPSLPQNKHESRIDFPVLLNLREIKRIEHLFVAPFPDEKFVRIFKGACKFYLQALQSIEHDPEVAYLHLITTGEILSNFYDEDVADRTKGRSFQVTRRFRKTINDLIPPDSDFFQRTESIMPPIGQFQSDNFADAISAAYKLRSKYVHTGMPFGAWIKQDNNNSERIGNAVVEDSELGTILSKAPSYVGLERVMRYCLLQFAKTQGVYQV